MWHIYPYSSGLLHWHCDNNTIVLCKYSEGYGAKSTSQNHCNDAIMSAVASQITSVSIVCLAVGSGADQRKHQSSASLSLVRGIHRSLVNSAHKRPVGLTRKMFPFDDVIMKKHNKAQQRVCALGLRITERIESCLCDKLHNLQLGKSSRLADIFVGKECIVNVMSPCII